MLKIKNIISITILCLAASTSSFAEDKIVAKYNGKNLYESEAEQKLKTLLGGELPEGKKKFSELNTEMQKNFISEMLNHKIAEDAMKNSPIIKTDSYKNHLQSAHDQAAIALFLQHHAKSKIKDQDIKKEYSNFIKTLKDNDELKVSHILVKDEAEAKKIYKDITNEKTTFAQAAKDYSIDNTKATSGEIGYLTKGQGIDPAFEKAAYSLKKGQMSKPVHTSFGWHIIKVDDIRKQKIPTFEEIKAQLEQKLMMEHHQQHIKKLTKDANTEVLVK